MSKKYIATANKIASNCYGLIEGYNYIIEQKEDGTNIVYDLHMNYITSSRTDAFEDYDPLEVNMV